MELLILNFIYLKKHNLTYSLCNPDSNNSFELQTVQFYFSEKKNNANYWVWSFCRVNGQRFSEPDNTKHEAVRTIAETFTL